MPTREQIIQQHRIILELQGHEAQRKGFENVVSSPNTTVILMLRYDGADCEEDTRRYSYELIEIKNDSDYGKKFIQLMREVSDEKIKELKEKAGLSE